MQYAYAKRGSRAFNARHLLTRRCFRERQLCGLPLLPAYLFASIFSFYNRLGYFLFPHSVRFNDGFLATSRYIVTSKFALFLYLDTPQIGLSIKDMSPKRIKSQDIFRTKKLCYHSSRQKHISSMSKTCPSNCELNE